VKHLLNTLDLKVPEIEKIFRRAASLKKERRKGRFNFSLRGKTLGMLFEKASTRTRVSFEVAMNELGGAAIYLESGSTQVGRGETYADTARVLSRYLHGIMIRTFGHNIAEELARHATIPVINGLTDLYHPCQILTDLFTVRECRKGKKICYIGDGNNMTNSWIVLALQIGFRLSVATPKGFGPSPAVLDLCEKSGFSFLLTEDPAEAVDGADVINTDTWFSMGQKEDEEKRRLFRPFQLNRELLKKAGPDAIVLHCLPAHRGEEITDEVMDGPQSRIWEQAENRLHVQKAILEMLLK